MIQATAMAELSAAVTLARRRREGTLTVSAAPVFAAKWLVWRLDGFHEAHPHIRIRVDAISRLGFAPSWRSPSKSDDVA